jgi:hypothetical protein
LETKLQINNRKPNIITTNANKSIAIPTTDYVWLSISGRFLSPEVQLSAEKSTPMRQTQKTRLK